MVDLPEGKDLVHHIDLFLCDDLLKDRFRVPGECGSFSAFMHTAKGPCYQLLFAYDRGASGFRLPKDVGFAIGKGTPFTKLLLQIHYLMPKEALEKDVVRGTALCHDAMMPRALRSTHLPAHSARPFVLYLRAVEPAGAHSCVYVRVCAYADPCYLPCLCVCMCVRACCCVDDVIRSNRTTSTVVE